MTSTLAAPRPPQEEKPAESSPRGAAQRRTRRATWVRPARSTWLRTHRTTLTWLSPILAVAALVQAINLGGSPQRIDDEGTYTAQAWAVNNLGELAHYTFWYDHPPVGWIQIAAWTGLTGGFQRYDIAVLAAREAMVVATLISVALIWFLSRRIGLSRPASAVASLIFALSPLSVQFHRTVYLDNVATPWLLASVLLAMTRRHQLAGFAGSAAAFGIAVLSKETYLLALPLIAWLMWKNSRASTRRYTLSVAGTLLALIGGSYLLLAIVKGELIPGPDRVSLFDGVAFQLASRESSGSILDPTSLSGKTVAVWLQLDPVLSVIGPLAAIAGLFVRRLRPFAIALTLLLLLMFRPGGYLPVPYVIMLLPFAAILIAGVTDVAIRTWRRRRGVRRVPRALWLAAVVAATAVLVPTWTTQLRGLVLSDLDAPSRSAQSWIVQNVAKDARLIVDDVMWVDLVTAGFQRDNVIWFYKLDTDPAVQAQSPNGWRDSDYIVTTRSMLTSPNATSAGQAIANSVVVAAFGQGDQAVDVRRIMPTGLDSAKAAADAVASTRTRTGLELASNPGLTASAQDVLRLRAGQVDERAVIAIGQLLASGPVAVGGFPIVPGEEGLVFRQVVIDSISGAPTVVDGQATAQANELLAAITGRYRPQAVEVSGGGLLVTFSVIPPDGLVQ